MYPFASWCITVAVLWGLTGAPADSFAQPATAQDRKWEIEIHAGGVVAGSQGEGLVAMPTTGESFTTVNARPSRYVPSWYFGDGAALANEHAAAFTNIVRTSRITSLDPVLTGTAARAAHRASTGVRVRRHLSPRRAFR